MHIDINEYDFTFPTELIAQRALPKGQSKILVLSKTTTTKEIVPAHCILEHLKKGDCLGQQHQSDPGTFIWAKRNRWKI
jgi:S-adenosylmethionine:tRNA-ribosyltransferase-isomerase (queuine synthetase)